MKLDLKILVWGGDYNYDSITLPDDGIICETSSVHMRNDYVTGYIYATSNTEENRQLINTSLNSHVYFTPKQIIVYMDRCKIESDVKLSTLDELNAYVDFNYWIEMRNLSMIPLKTLQEMYGNDIQTAVKQYVNFYAKPLKFIGEGSFVETFEVHKNCYLDEKLIDQISRETREFDLFDTETIDKLRPTWRPFEEANEVVQQRIKEILYNKTQTPEEKELELLLNIKEFERNGYLVIDQQNNDYICIKKDERLDDMDVDTYEDLEAKCERDGYVFGNKYKIDEILGQIPNYEIKDYLEDEGYYIYNDPTDALDDCSDYDIADAADITYLDTWALAEELSDRGYFVQELATKDTKYTICNDLLSDERYPKDKLCDLLGLQHTASKEDILKEVEKLL